MNVVSTTSLASTSSTPAAAAAADVSMESADWESDEDLPVVSLSPSKKPNIAERKLTVGRPKRAKKLPKRFAGASKKLPITTYVRTTQSTVFLNKTVYRFNSNFNFCDH